MFPTRRNVKPVWTFSTRMGSLLLLVEAWRFVPRLEAAARSLFHDGKLFTLLNDHDVSRNDSVDALRFTGG